MTGNVKWLKDKQDNIIIPNTLTTSVYNSDNKNIDELLNELIKIQENKVDKVEGKGLSTNDFTNEDKEKLNSIIADPNNITIDTALSETSENPVQNKVITSKLNEVFQSVSNGKSLIASAITDKGVSTDAEATFDTMAGNIMAIETGGGGGVTSAISITKAQVNQYIASDSYSVSKEE